MTALALCCLFLLPAGSIVVDIASDMSREAAARDIARLSAPLPPPRPLDPALWPRPVTPLDLPSVGDTEALAAVELAPRVFTAAPEPLVVGLSVGEGRHHVGVAPGTEDQRTRWNTPTGEFWLIVEGLTDLSEPCSHCGAPEDGEPAHVGCPGCACPCSMAEVTS